MITILLLALTLSLDSFFTSISYGINNIKISKTINFIISSIGTILLGITLFFTNFLSGFLSNSFCIFSSFIILFSLGCYRIFEQSIKNFLKNRNNRFFKVYIDETTADFDQSHELSIKESIILGIVLSLDSIGSGIGIGLSPEQPIILLFFTFLFTILFIRTGCLLGKKIIKKVPNIGWISGLLLILLSFLRLIA